MTVSIRIPGATFTKFVDLAVPHIDRATGFWLFGGSKEESQVNLATNGPSGSPSWVGDGDPAFGDGWAEMSYAGATSAALDTGISVPGAEDFSYIAVCGRSHNNTICGTWHSGTTAAMLYSNTSGVLNVASDGAAVAPGGLIVPAAGMTFLAGTRSAAARIVYMHDGSEMQSASGAPRAGGPSNTFRIGPYGGFGNSATTTRNRIAAVMWFPEVLSAGEIGELYDYLKWKLAQRGVAVT